MKKTIFLALYLALTACPVYDPALGTLSIHNYSDSAVYIYNTCGDSLKSEPNLELFLVDSTDRVDSQGKKMPQIYSPNYRINAYSYGKLYGFGSENDRKVPCSHKRLRLFFLKEKTIRQKTWQEIVSEKLYQKKMSFSESQLDSMNWEIKYEE